MLSEVSTLNSVDVKDIPFYQAQANEVTLFEHAYKNKLPLLIKGPRDVVKLVLSSIWRQN